MESPNSQLATAVVIGLGEMGGVFARALLKAGHIVVPVTRHTDLEATAAAFPDPEVVLITVGESDLAEVLAALPATWKRRAALLQNELLPRDWEAHGIIDPTIAVVWFEKKPGQDVKVIIPSPIGGPYASELSAALDAIDIPSSVVADAADLTAELVTKNLYILTVNIGGLTTGGTVDELWNGHRDFAVEVAEEVLAIQAWLAGRDLDGPRHIAGMEEAIAGDPEHKATGRSAPARLARALHNAAHAEIATPRLLAIAAEHVDS
jgi:ketopantoate reductase